MLKWILIMTATLITISLVSGIEQQTIATYELVAEPLGSMEQNQSINDHELQINNDYVNGVVSMNDYIVASRFVFITYQEDSFIAPVTSGFDYELFTNILGSMEQNQSINDHELQTNNDYLSAEALTDDYLVETRFVYMTYNEEVVTGDSIPVVNNISITPSSGFPSTVFSVIAQGSDPEGSDVTYFTTIYVNNILNQTIINESLPSGTEINIAQIGNLTAGDDLFANFTVFDGVFNSTEATSNLVTVEDQFGNTELPIYVRPLVNEVIIPNTLYEYTFNFTTDDACSNVVKSITKNITTDLYGLGHVNIDLDGITTSPLFVCEYRNNILRQTHKMSSGIFDDIFVSGDLRTNDGSPGLTNTSGFWLCTDASCTNKCQVEIKNGIITGCT